MKMLFSKPQTAFGLGVLSNTVRAGDKWLRAFQQHRLDANREDVPFIVPIAQVGSEDEPTGVALVNDVVFIPFDLLKGMQRVLESNYAPNARTYEGLLEDMKSVYPHFQETEPVSIVFYNYVPLYLSPDERPDEPVDLTAEASDIQESVS
jgi:hypothetical protein